MAQHPFPGPGHDGDEPLPAEQARDWAEEDGRYLDWLTAQGADDVRSLDDDKLLGVILAARRQQTRAEYEELAAVAEFARRREAEYEASKARGDKPRHRDGEFAAEELGMELNCSHYAAGRRMELAGGLASRLPCTFAGMAAGTIDGHKARIIYEFTRYLSGEQARRPTGSWPPPRRAWPPPG